jgi:hypothetical protein
MSRGLSQQQRAILGLGVRINLAVNGGELVPGRGKIVMPGDPGSKWRNPAMLGGGFAEITTRYVLHLLHGVPISSGATWWRAGHVRAAGKPHQAYVNGSEISVHGFFVHDDRTRSLKATTTRAISTLLKRGHIIMMIPPSDALQWWEHARRRALQEAMPPRERLAISWGYVLTDKGIAVGKDHEPDLDPVTVLRGLKSLQHEHKEPLVGVLDGLLAAGRAARPRTRRPPRSGSLLKAAPSSRRRSAPSTSSTNRA